MTGGQHSLRVIYGEPPPYSGAIAGADVSAGDIRQIRFVGPHFKRNSGPHVTRGTRYLQSNRELLNDFVCDLNTGNSSSLKTFMFDLEVIAARR